MKSRTPEGEEQPSSTYDVKVFGPDRLYRLLRQDRLEAEKIGKYLNHILSMCKNKSLEDLQAFTLSKIEPDLT